MIKASAIILSVLFGFAVNKHQASDGKYSYIAIFNTCSLKRVSTRFRLFVFYSKAYS